MSTVVCSTCGRGEPEVRLARNRNGMPRPTCCCCLADRARHRHHPEEPYAVKLGDDGAEAVAPLPDVIPGEGRRAWVTRCALHLWESDYPVTRVAIDDMVEITGLTLRTVRDLIEAARVDRLGSRPGIYVTIPRVELKD
jgi:hypothetical protein